MVRRLILFVVVTALLVAASVWLAERPGEVDIRWLGWRVIVPVPLFLLALVLLLGLGAMALRLVRAILGAPGRLVERRRARRTHDGYLALSDGLAAVAVGDRRRARKLARRADKLLADRALTGLLTAQAAELDGDEAEAARRFEAMVGRPESAFVGLKGLLALALKRGDHAAALDYARRAWALGGSGGGIAATLFDLQARAGQWSEAEATLTEARRRGALEGGEYGRLRALALLERSRASSPDALSLALKAHQLDIGLVPAAQRAARLLHQADKPRKAVQAILTTWKVAPHPALVEAALALAPAETPLQRVKRVEKLVKANPDSPDGHIALAEAALAAKLWGLARTHLERALAQRPSAGVLVLLARLEREERGDEAAAQAWLARMPGAPAEPAWVCRCCGRVVDEWVAACPQCGSIDSLDWRQPAAAGLPVPVSAAAPAVASVAP